MHFFRTPSIDIQKGTQTTNKFHKGNRFVVFQHWYFGKNALSHSFENSDEAKLVLNYLSLSAANYNSRYNLVLLETFLPFNQHLNKRHHFSDATPATVTGAAKQLDEAQHW